MLIYARSRGEMMISPCSLLEKLNFKYMETRMSRKANLMNRLTAKFAPDLLEIIDESHMHAGTALETHFKVIMVSSAFEGLSRVRRHQAVYAEAAAAMASGLHALALHLYTLGEWQVQQSAPDSPNCRGGSQAD